MKIYWFFVARLPSYVPDLLVLEPDVVSSNAASSACEKSLWPEQALQLVRARPQQSVQPDAIRCNASISVCEEGARPKQALELLRVTQWQSVKPG